MKVRGNIEDIWYGSRRGLLPPLLGAASLLYGAGHGARRALYRLGLKKSVNPGVPCISVGNIVVGGTGKTPASAWLVKELLRRRRKPAVVSRGYGGVTVHAARVPSGGGSDVSRRFGDEPAMLASAFPDVPVIVARDRSEGAAVAVADFGADMIVADDAFQHWRLSRSLDIVLVDALRWFGNGRLLPGGPLREPLQALARADALFLTRPEADREEEQLEALRGLSPDAVVASAEIVPACWRRWDGAGETAAPVGPLFAFCGIAHPLSFRKTIEGQGALAGWRAFADHHPYSEGETEILERQAGASGAAAAVTTAKDAVRLSRWSAKVPLYVLEVRLSVRDEAGTVRAMVDALAGRREP